MKTLLSILLVISILQQPKVISQEVIMTTVQYALKQKWIAGKSKTITVVLASDAISLSKSDLKKKCFNINIIEGNFETKLYNDNIRINKVYQKGDSIVLNIETVFAKVTSREIFILKKNNRFTVVKNEVNYYWSE